MKNKKINILTISFIILISSIIYKYVYIKNNFVEQNNNITKNKDIMNIYIKKIDIDEFKELSNNDSKDQKLNIEKNVQLVEEDFNNYENKVIKIFGKTIKNIKKECDAGYFQNSCFLNNYYEGFYNSQEYLIKKYILPKISKEIYVSNRLIKKALGFEVLAIKKESEIGIPEILSNKNLYIKYYGVYEKYSFDVYGFKNKYKGKKYIYKPIGIFLEQDYSNKR